MTASATPPHWLEQIQTVLTEAGAEGPWGECCEGFEPVLFWLSEGLAPVLAEICKLRGESPATALGVQKLWQDWQQRQHPEPAEWDAATRNMVKEIARFGFAFDREFDAAFESAESFAADHPDMIRAHFGNAENYAEYYAQSNTEALQGFAGRTVQDIQAGRIAFAVATQDLGAFAAGFPGALLRNLLQAYQFALGPMTQKDLAARLQDKLQASQQLT